MGKGPGLYSDIGKRARGSRFVSLYLENPIHFFTLTFLFYGCIMCNFLFFFVLLLDLLYRDYQSDQKFTLTTYSPTGVVSDFVVFFADLIFPPLAAAVVLYLEISTSSLIF